MKKLLMVMDSTGDSRVEFEPGSAAEGEALALYNRLTAKSAAVFAVNRAAGAPDKRVTSFDQLETENVIVPGIAGG